ncbi:hypothetical protein J6590_018772 [Homalodisca vitripennis]|nr:hypothetical protein J6590_018772 [Homalodisca vitripennis]
MNFLSAEATETGKDAVIGKRRVDAAPSAWTHTALANRHSEPSIPSGVASEVSGVLLSRAF